MKHLIVVALALATAVEAAEPAVPSPVQQRWGLTDAKRHLDFPALALDGSGTPWVAFIEHDGQADVLKLARKTANGLEVVASVSRPGIVHQPAVAVAGDGAVWCFWGQVDERDVVTLRARRFAADRLDDEISLATSAASDTFADAGTDHAGRVWVVWQSMRRGQGDVFARWLDPSSGQWSKEFAISKLAGGNWEPRIAFDGKGGAWVVFDSSRDGDFNLYLAHVAPDGRIEERQLTDTRAYEARARIAVAQGGQSLWITAERGRLGWGKQLRGHDGEMGLNGQKSILLGRFDVASGKFTEVDVPPRRSLAPRATPSVNLPSVAVDAEGHPVIAFRYYADSRWLIALARYDEAAGSWSQSQSLPGSALGQDRHATLTRAGDTMWLCWPSDLRNSKAVRRAGVYLGELDAAWTSMVAPGGKVAVVAPKPYLNAPTPPRPRDEHHTWEIGGKKFTLMFGDVHRHTDFSNCRTGQEGCVLEQFRYAYDVAALDFLGTSDHTDAAKIYDPYEWWQTQRMTDVFYVPGRLISLYAYEREQAYPWGHRNVVFAQRGGPVVYLSRQAYKTSPWGELYPVKAGAGQITPMELWEVLGQYGKPVAVISHTGATGMGTDWDRYKRIDGRVENTVEIFQGARVSYEGVGAPQPTVGLRAKEHYTADTASQAPIPPPPAAIANFGKERNRGTYQHALAQGHHLGVFASSDHIATHTAFGGVYVEERSRVGIIEGLRVRRSIAATDKIFVEFSCNGKPMGEVFEAKGNPELKFAIGGTAPITRVTVVRNEVNYKVWEPGGRDFVQTFVDPAPVAGENRYYLRVEQNDGNMAWSSPVWVTIKE